MKHVTYIAENKACVNTFYDIPQNSGGKLIAITRHFFVCINFGYVLLISVIGFTI